jgi:rhodanese-related sulfurtransferase
MEHLGEFIINHWVLVTLFVVLSGLVFSDGIQQKLGGAKPLPVNDAVRIVNQLKGQFIDIREKEEFEKEHIADSINQPLSGLKESLVKAKNKSKPVVLVCASGQRARGAAKTFRQNGFEDVYILAGGLHAWKQAKLPLFG